MRIIAGTARGRSILSPAGKKTRPTLDRVRENLFNILQMRVRNSRVLDLFAGTGALSFEALSRGADHAVLVDIDRNAFQVERRNAEILGFTHRTEILMCDWRKAVRYLKSKGSKFDLIFLDPPYAMTDMSEVFMEIRELLNTGGMVVLEHESGVAIDSGGLLHKTDERKWGFCSVSFYRSHEGEGTDGGD